MRQHIDEVYANGQVVERTTIPWTIEDYKFAIETNEEKEPFIDELQVLLGTKAMLQRIDQVADAKRMEFLGDVTRAFEYQAAERDAKLYAANDFQGEVPLAVQAWADAVGFSAEDAAKNILQESALYNYALNMIRAVRLQAKQSINRETNSEIILQTYFQALATLRSIGQ